MSCCTVVVDKHTSSTRHFKGIWFWQLQGLNMTTAMQCIHWRVSSMVSGMKYGDFTGQLTSFSGRILTTNHDLPSGSLHESTQKNVWESWKKTTSFSPLSSFCCWESLDWQVPIILVGSCLDHTAILPKLFRLSRTAQRQARFEWTPEMLASTKSSGNA